MTRRSDPIKKAAGRPRSDAKAGTPPGPIAAQPKPSREVGGFPIVGIGASAGGLAAFEAFFSGMPADTEPGMAFVLVQHLAPDHKSILTDLLGRYTRMRVFEVEDGMAVMPNCAYIIPPGRDMAFLGGTLQLLEPAAPRGQRMPIDFFFRSLAQDQHERAIGVVLSGTGSDGTLGVRAIKGEGGMVMVQTPVSTEYDGMPCSAMATGLVDYELPPAEMAAQLIAYTTHAFGKPPRPAVLAPKTESALKKVFVLLRAQTGHDFSQYKPSTVRRRIERRMAVHQIESMEDYVKFSQQTPEEVDALFRDMLIGVTNFFRDPEAFTAIEEQVIPKLFADKPDDAAIRVWVPGCSTGEEAYSLAILLAERQEALKRGFRVQVFATDIDSHAIAAARAGIYPASVATDLTPERLSRFFSPEPGDIAYRIHKGIRDMLVFSEQNVIKDPPFSKLDLISCRNLLIYLDVDLHKKLVPLFHYSLNPGGYLFLGTSETVGGFSDLFATLELKQKIYQRKEDLLGAQRAGLGRFPPPMTAADLALPHVAEKTAGVKKPPLRELTEQALLQQDDQAGALVNAQGDILYLHGRTGMYLEPTPGEIGCSNILKMAREGLRRDLNTALHKAVATRKTVCCSGLRVKTNGDFTTVNLLVRPVAAAPSASPESPLYLVVLEQAQEPAVRGQAEERLSDEPANVDADARIAELKRELQAKEEYLQTTTEELETSNEELKSANEEMQSINEELQSTNEELETSKEELQSINEELSTVNAELQTKVADLSRANNDMNNLLAGTGIATVFVDIRLRLMRFTPSATRIINLIHSDIGRPVGHIVSNLPGYGTLTEDIQAVLDTLIPKEAEVQTAEGRWYTMRIQPYRTMDNVIEGAVLTFVDITERRQAEAKLAESQKLLSRSQGISHTGSWKLDLTTNRLTWSDEVYRIFGFEREGFVATYDAFLDAVHPDDRAVVDEAYSRSLQEGSDGYEIEHRIVRRNSGEVRHVHERCVHERDAAGTILHSTGMVQDVTERKWLENYSEMGLNILRILNGPGDLQESIQRVLAVLKTQTGVDAVGLRLQEGDDFPYFVQNGFSKDFLQTENTLVERGKDGGVCRDEDGNVSLECTCGLVIAGKTDPSNPLFTKGGSCWTNDSFPLIDLPSDQDPRLHARNHCIHQGYASVALIPIRTRDRIVGLIQLNDRRKSRFTLETIGILEGIAANIGSALMRKRMEEALRVNEERLRVALSATSISVFNQDVDLRYTWIHNPNLGFTAEEIIGKTDADLLPEQEAAALTAVKQQVLASGKGMRQKVLTTIAGETVVYDLTVEPLRDSSSGIVGITCASLDVTGQQGGERTDAGADQTLPSVKDGDNP